MTFRFTDRDRGYSRLMRNVRAAIGYARVSIGITEDSGAARQIESDLTVLEVALVHEFGSRTVPARSFIRSWNDQNRERNRARLRSAGIDLLRGADREAALRRIGAEMLDECRAAMRAGLEPPLQGDDGRAPLTGGQLEDALTAEVRT